VGFFNFYSSFFWSRDEEERARVQCWLGDGGVEGIQSFGVRGWDFLCGVNSTATKLQIIGFGAWGFVCLGMWIHTCVRVLDKVRGILIPSVSEGRYGTVKRVVNPFPLLGYASLSLN